MLPRLLALTALAFLAAPLLAQDAPPPRPHAGDQGLVTIEVQDVPLAEAAKLLSAQAGVRIDVAEGLGDGHVFLAFSEAPLAKVLAVMAAFAKGEVVRRGPGHFAIQPRGVVEEWRRQVGKLLDDEQVNLNFLEAPFGDVLGFLGSSAGIQIQADPQLAARPPAEMLVSFRAEDITVRSALNLVATAKGLAWDLRWGGVFVGTAERLAVLPAQPLAAPRPDAPAWEARLREKLAGPVTFSFAETTLSQICEFLRTMMGVNLVFVPAARERAEKTTLSLSVSDLPLAHALSLLLLPRGFTFSLANEVILIE